MWAPAVVAARCTGSRQVRLALQACRAAAAGARAPRPPCIWEAGWRVACSLQQQLSGLH